MVRLLVVHSVFPRNGVEARGTLQGKLCCALLTVRPPFLLLHLVPPVEMAPTPRALEALLVVGAQAMLDGLADNRLATGPTPPPHLPRVTLAAHEVVVVVMEVPVDEPVATEDAPEALGVPTPGVVVEVAHGPVDALLAFVALGHGLHALVAVQRVVHLEVVAVLEVLAAPSAHKARVVPAGLTDLDPLVLESDWLGALVAEDGVLGVAGVAVDVVLVGIVGLVLEWLVALGAAEVLLVPILSLGVRECARKYQLQRNGGKKISWGVR